MGRELTEAFFKAVIMIISVILTVYVIPWLKERIGAEKFERLKEYTEYAVRCAEQICTDNKDKKTYVYNYILKKSEELGLNLTPGDIDLLVEGAVNLIKHGGE